MTRCSSFRPIRRGPWVILAEDVAGLYGLCTYGSRANLAAEPCGAFIWQWDRWSWEQAMADGARQVRVVSVQGELDLATADNVATRGYAAIGDQPRVLLLDLAGVSFCDAGGLSALVRIANRADATGCPYGLIAPRPQLMKVLRITGLDQRLPVFASVNDALAHLIRATGSSTQ